MGAMFLKWCRMNEIILKMLLVLYEILYVYEIPDESEVAEIVCGKSTL